MDGLAFVHVGAAALAGFFASVIQCVASLSVVLAIASVRGWQGALAGSVSGIMLLAVAARVLVWSLASVPLGVVHLVLGTLLLLFGLRWLREAMLRAAGAIPLHDQAALYAKEVTALRALEGSAVAFHSGGTAKALTTVITDGVEVVFIVVAFVAGGSGLIEPVTVGALAGLLLVVLSGTASFKLISGPLNNPLKFAAGVLLSAFGTIWAGDGIGTQWPRIDEALIGLSVGYVLVAIGCVGALRRAASAGSQGSGR